MSIDCLEIQNFRNLKEVKLELDAYFNIFYGQNGSGKTSLLEAVSFLASGRSFRARSVEQLIQHTENDFSLFCKLKIEDDEIIPIGTQRGVQGQKRIRVAEKEESSYLVAARYMPVLTINTDEHRLITGSPEYRRQFMNWGMFHVEHSFYTCWQRLQQAVKQRNAVLRRNGSFLADEIEVWNRELASISHAMDEMRRQYIAYFSPYFLKFVELLLPDLPEVELNYYPGWKEKETLEEALRRSFYRDRQVGYTQYGPHRSDLKIKVGDFLAKDILSRGQQKLITYALWLGQGLLLQNHVQRSCIYLIDDFIAELDKKKRMLVFQSLKQLSAQTFITGVEKGELEEVMKETAFKMFHVEHGRVKEALSNSTEELSVSD